MSEASCPQAQGSGEWRIRWQTTPHAAFIAVGSTVVRARTRIGAIRAWRSRGYHRHGYSFYAVIPPNTPSETRRSARLIGHLVALRSTSEIEDRIFPSCQNTNSQ
jgi:hypothetical protein